MADPAEGTSGGAPILSATDFSPDSEAALAWAVRLAVALDAPLLLLHVVHDPEAAPGTYSGAQRGPGAGQEQVAEEMLTGFVERMRSKLPELARASFASRVVVGLPASRILEVAEQSGARMIVMGGTGRTGLADLLLGSKVERVARLAPIPVLIVKGDREARGRDAA